MKLPENHTRNGPIESFQYRGYECRISYNGLRPHFNIDGRNAEKVLEDFEVTTEKVGRSGWRHTLMKEIDKHEGLDVKSDEYVEPQKREIVRKFARRYVRYIANRESSWRDGVKLIESSNSDILEIQDWVSDRMLELLTENEITDSEKRMLRSYEESFDEFF